MKRTFLLAPFVLASLHCGSAPPPPASIALGDAGPPAVTAVTTPGNAAADLRAARFPGGEGTTLDDDQLYDAFRDSTVRNGRASQADRVAAARQILGVEPVRDGDDYVFPAVSARTVVGAYGCRELRIQPAGSNMGPADHRLCGLPYLSQLGMTAYTGPGARYPLHRLVRAQADLATRPESLKMLGKPDRETVAARTWFAVGGRNDDGPITCHALVVGATSAIVDAPLADCGIAWPPPASAFERGADQPSVPIRARLDACSTCDPSQVCLLDQTTPRDARTTERNGELRATYVDGRPATVAVTQTCIARPTTCPSASSSCWWGPPGNTSPPGINAGPCATEGFHGVAVSSSPGKTLVVRCMRWTN